MNIEHKNTVLEDDAKMYSKGKDTVTKEQLKNLTKKQKLTYFKDYYLKFVIVGIILLIGAGSVINTTIINPQKTVLTLATINECQLLDTEGPINILTEYLAVTDKNENVNVAYYNLDDYQMNMAFVTHAAAGGLDLVICTEDYFTQGSEQGMFLDLKEFLPEETYNLLSDRIIMGRRVDEYDEQSNPISYLEEKAYGIDLTGSIAYKEFGGMYENPVLCVISSVANPDNAIKTISYLTQFEP